MLCQECQKDEATIQVIKSVDGVRSEFLLCEQCARNSDELDFTFEPSFSLHKLFSSMLNQNMIGSRDAVNTVKLQCSSCGLTFAQFSQIGRLGCSECFKAFQEKLLPLLNRIHASSSHTGKVPGRVMGKVKVLKKIDKLKSELKEKISKEQFEEAALIRDQIKDMQNKIEHSEHQA